MKRVVSVAAVVVSMLVVTTMATSGDGNHRSKREYQVTITNATKGETFTPLLVVSHRGPLQMFELGEAASTELETVAETGDTGPLKDLLLATGQVIDVASAGGLLGPGESVDVDVMGHRSTRISVIAMLIPSNDAFVAFQNLRAPRGHRVVKSRAPAYDSGTEFNDEDCVNIPGPFCMGDGTTGSGSEENGVVHIHAGVHGIGGIPEEDFDWHNPVAQIKIRRK